MSIQITEDLQKVLDTASSLEEVISVKATNVPVYLMSEIPLGDYIYLDYIIRVENGENVEVGFVVPTKIINADSYKNLPIKDLVGCSCVTMGGKEDDFCVNNPYYNTEKTNYIIRDTDHYLTRILASELSLDVQKTENLEKLIKKLENVDKVKRIIVEKVANEKLKQSLDLENSVIIKAYIDVDNDENIDHFVSFALTELVYDIETSHEWAVNNLIELIGKNNAK